MKYLDLGQQGVRASAVAAGCMRIRELTDEELAHFVHRALELGVNLFDHADIYGKGACEEKFGDLLGREPALRERLLLQSKCGIRSGFYDFSREHILSSVENSLRRLRTDHLDILLLHRPDALMEPEEVAEAFRTLKESGKVLHFGVSNFNSMQLALLQSALREPLLIDQLQFSLAHTGMIDSGILANTKFPGSENRDGSVLDYCRLHHITIQAWSPFQYGCFEGVFFEDPKYPELNRVLNELAARYGVTPTGIATAWLLRHPAGVQVIAGTTRISRLEEMCQACEITLTRPEWYALYRAAGNQLP